MQYISHYESPLGRILLAADEEGLTGLWFEGQKYFARSLRNEQEEKEIPLFERAKRWLDLYFSGTEPDLSVPLHFLGTDFQKKVWEILCAIPYGHTMTYGEIAGHLAAEKGSSLMSARGGRRRGGPQSHLDPGALSSGGGSLRQSHRLCRGPGSKSKIIDTGENGYAGTFYPQEGNRFMKTEERML